MDPEVVTERKRVARIQLEFCAKLYKIQHDAGRYFVHKHPNSATSWHEEVIVKMCNIYGILTVVADQCEYGLVTITSVKRLAGAYTCPHFDLVVDNANQRILVVDHEVPKSVKMHVCTQLE